MSLSGSSEDDRDTTDPGLQQSLKQIRAFVEGGTEALAVERPPRGQAYELIAETVRRLGYARLPRADKGLVVRYLIKVTGLSRQQLTRLIGQFRDSGRLRDRRGPPARPFPRRYTREDVLRLAELDALHGNLSGPATRRLCERAYHVFGDRRYERLAGLSNGHLYNLRYSTTYRRRRGQVDKPAPVQVAIDEHRKPIPGGRPGYLRVDSVHQSDLKRIKGLYLINAIDEITQFQCIAAVAHISEHFLLPILAAFLVAFPFAVHGFHTANGSEYINHRVAMLLNKLHASEFTKSRTHRTGDNALIESKNGSVVHKHLGYAHIPARLAKRVNTFTQGVLSPYLNFHCPCFFPQEHLNAKSRRRKRYPYEVMMTPYEKLKALPQPEQWLKPTISLKEIDTLAHAISENEAARRLNQARAELFREINKPQIPNA